MVINRLKARDYSIIIGRNSLLKLKSEVKSNCPNCNKIAIIIDRKIPKKFLRKIKNNLKQYRVFIFLFPPQKRLKFMNRRDYSSINC